MKKVYSLLFIISLFIINVQAQVTFCEDFESYSNASPIAQTSSDWNSWDELMNGSLAPFTDDVTVSNLSSSSGTNSLYFPNNGVAGPEDVLLMFDTMSNITQASLPLLSTPYVSGDFEFSQMMYVRSGGGAYFNFQAENMPGQVWALEVAFDITGDVMMSNTSGTSFACGYPFDQWFEIKFDINLSNNIWEVFIDGVSQGSFANTINQIASLDLYTRACDEFYIDDVCFSYTPATLAQINGQTTLINTITGLAGQQRYPSVEVRNFGIEPMLPNMVIPYQELLSK